MPLVLKRQRPQDEGVTTTTAPRSGSATRSADAALLAVALMWGGSYLAAQVMTDVAAPSTVLALRFLPSALVLIAVAVIRRATFSRRVLWVGLVLGVFQAVTLLLETYAVTRTSATNAGVLVCLTIVIAPALEGVTSRTPLPRPYYAAAALSIVGVALLLGPSGLTAPNLGDLFVLLAATTRALLMVFSGHLTRGHSFDAVALNTVQTCLNAILFTAVAGPAIGPTLVGLDGWHWLDLAFLSLGCACAAFLLQLWAIHHTSATRASLLMGTEPLWALAFGILLAGDRPGIIGFIGAVVIITATWWANASKAAGEQARRCDSPVGLTSESPAEFVGGEGSGVPGLLTPTGRGDEARRCQNMQVVGGRGRADGQGCGDVRGAGGHPQVLQNRRARRAHERGGRAPGTVAAAGDCRGVTSRVVDRRGPGWIGHDGAARPTENRGAEAQAAATTVGRDGKTTLGAQNSGAVPAQAWVEVLDDGLQTHTRKAPRTGRDVGLENSPQQRPMRTHPPRPEHLPRLADLRASRLGIGEPVTRDRPPLGARPAQLIDDDAGGCGVDARQHVLGGGRAGLRDEVGRVPACPSQRSQHRKHLGRGGGADAGEQGPVQRRGLRRGQSPDRAGGLHPGRDREPHRHEIRRPENESVGPHPPTIDA